MGKHSTWQGRFWPIRRRTGLKIIHWGMVPLVLWFLVMTPADVARIGAGAVHFHSVLGLIFVTVSLLWTGDHLWRGLASRPGPKLPPWARLVHNIMHRVLIWGLFGVAFGGFLIGLTSTRLLWAGDILPIAPPLDLPQANALVGLAHTLEFYALAGVIICHAAFHVWRHYWLNDNALRIMVPRILHRFL